MLFERIKRTLHNKSKPALALCLCAAMLVPNVTYAVITDDMYDRPWIKVTWDPAQYASKNDGNYKETGLVVDFDYYPMDDKAGYPLGAAMEFAGRSGYLKDEYKDFVGRYGYCVANHVQNYLMYPGMQLFLNGEYNTGDMPDFIHGSSEENKQFNFLMLAIASGYPANYTAGTSESFAYNVICQTIDWIITDPDPFTGAPQNASSIESYFKADLEKFHASAHYKALVKAFRSSVSPEINKYLTQAPPANSAAAKDMHLTNTIDAAFYDIWMAAYLTSKLTPDWQSYLTSTYTTAELGEDGYYHAYVPLFQCKEALIYLDGMTPTMLGDWEFVGNELSASGDGTMVQHFKSPTGETVDGEICTLSWKDTNTIGELMPVDQTKAKLYTFVGFTATAGKQDDYNFNNSQTRFSSVIEQGLTVHVRIGGEHTDAGDKAVKVTRHEHTETFDATYNVNLYKFDAETGKPLADSHWDVLERFDSSQLANTDLDRAPDSPGDYESGIGTLKSTEAEHDTIEENYEGNMGVTECDANKYNWANDDGTQFEFWDDEHNDPCERDDNVTKEDGKLYEIDSSGNASDTVAHTDIKSYVYHKGYCDGHPAPEIKYIECDHADGESCNCAEENQKLHDAAWKEWYAEVEKCEQLVEEGGFFHAIEEGAAKEAMEADRDQFYKDFISLTYEYSAEEIIAPKGYILHGNHTDDIPIEWRNVTSSEYKDTEEATNIEHSDGNDADTDDGDEEGEEGEGEDTEEGEDSDDEEEEDEEDLEELSLQNSSRAASEVLTSTSKVGSNGSTANSDVSDTLFVSASRKDKNQTDTDAVDTETFNEESEELNIPDIEISGDESAMNNNETATVSEATESDALPEHEIRYTGFIETVKEAANNIWSRITSFFSIRTASVEADDDENENEGDDNNDDDGSDDDKNGNWLRDTEKFEPTEANSVVLAASDIIDWTFITYDHRTEGEIHFNKRDFDLSNDTSDTYDDYTAENGDGTLEGAVYGLFAAQDIIHPDTDNDSGEASEGDTGVVFKKDDLVAIATTDRNGDGSFMAITEAPGTRYNYETGSTETYDWYDNAPKNLHIPEGESAEKERDIEAFVGHDPDNTEIKAGNGDGTNLPDTETADGTYFWKNSSNQNYDSEKLENNNVTKRREDTWREADTTGHYPIHDNETNNGNCWIGQPLILGKDGSSYYIKELSRSEGYELSVYGNDQKLITNRDAFEAGGEEFETGQAKATSITYDQSNGGNTFTVKSSNTKKGYILKVANIPERATFNITTSTTYMDENKTHQEAQNVEVKTYAIPGNYVYLGGLKISAKLGDKIEYNGKTFTVNNVKVIDNSKTSVKPDNRTYIENPALDVTKITPITNVMEDINTMFGKSGFRKVVNGCPWVSVQVDEMSDEAVAKAVNEQVLKNDYYSVFNAMEMLGTYVSNGKTYVAIGYCYRDTTTNQALYNEKNGKIYVKTNVTYLTQSGNLSGFAYRTYDAADCESVVKNENGFVTSAVVSNETASGSPLYAKEDMSGKVTFKVRPNESYWTYKEGEYLLTNDGEIAVHYEKKYVDVAPTQVTEVRNEELQKEYISYSETKPGAGTYTITISPELLKKTKDGTIDFRITYSDREATIDGVKVGCEIYAQSYGVIGVTYPYDTADSYIQTVMLMYPGQDKINSDGGTIETPVNVTERPIRQKIKVSKDIETLENPKSVWYCLNCGYENEDGTATCGYCGHERTTEETKTIKYAHDTYSAVHSENISANRDAGLFDTVKDWLTNLMDGKVEKESATDIPNFRFKAYLKSNLERLYRNEKGEIVWMDRNGNVMEPDYVDTNEDGNYDTFTWKYKDAYKGKSVDFPEKDKVSGTTLDSSNVQKIYTEISHDTESKTTSARSNNVWAKYNSPQSEQGDIRENVGEKEGYTTSERIDGNGNPGDVTGEAVDTSSTLYQYNGKNTNVNKDDKINDTDHAAIGSSRLLETTLQTIEDGTNTREVETYNYEKFFDAIQAANTDVWDDDMHTTFNGDAMSNYPGQHWFETFYEKYQKDDTDADHTKENTDDADKDNTTGGDHDTSFKPFRWIREHVFGDRSDYEKYPAEHNGTNTETEKSTSKYAKANAEASDAVRQFATKWYLKQEAAKLETNNGNDENIAAENNGTISYDEEIYDKALFEAIAKSYEYLKPFYTYDLDTIYSVEWDGDADGGSDNDYTTLSIDMDEGNEHTGVSAYLPYGTYVIVEQQPARRDGTVNDWENRSYNIEKPKEVMVPTLYEGSASNNTTDNYDTHYNYNEDMSTEKQAMAENYLLRFGEEWSDDAPNETQDERHYVIRAHNYHGDYEVYKYGLDIDLLNGNEQRHGNGINYNDTSYDYLGWKSAQEELDPLKDYYDEDHHGEAGVEQIGKENGGNDSTEYMAVNRTMNVDTANGTKYDWKSLKDRFFYASISEDKGIANDVMYKGGATDNNNVSGMQWEDGVTSMTGELTAYSGKYAQMLVPWSVIEPVDGTTYDSSKFIGYADVNERDGFYTTFLRVNKTDSETGEYILHDDAIFALYAGSRYQTFEEIEEDAKLIEDTEEREKFLHQFKPGDAKFYLQDTEIVGSMEFLKAMGAHDITSVVRGRSVTESGTDVGELYTGIVPKGTPVCVESERIMLTDELGNRTGQMTVYSTMNDVEVTSEDNDQAKEYVNQNTGYFVTPQPIGAGVYVLAEIKAPSGYVRSKPVAYEVYSDKTSYYVDGDMYNKADAVRYEGNLLTDINYKDAQ